MCYGMQLILPIHESVYDFDPSNNEPRGIGGGTEAKVLADAIGKHFAADP
jgi:hypothetical protein